MGCSDLRLVLSKEKFSYWYTPRVLRRYRRPITSSTMCANSSCSSVQHASTAAIEGRCCRDGVASLSCHHLGRRAFASLLMRAAINFLKLPMGLPLHNMKQIEGCSENQHLRNCGSNVRSNRGPARWHRPFNLSVWTVGSLFCRHKQSPQFLVHQEKSFMAMYINTNTSSLNAQRNLMNTNKSLDTSYTRLRDLRCPDCRRGHGWSDLHAATDAYPGSAVL